MELVYLSRADIEGLNYPMSSMLDTVDTALRLKGLGKTQMPPKPSIYPRPNSVMHPMPAYVAEVDAAGTKCISGYPSNPARGLPYISGLIVLNDPDTGIPIAVMDAAWVTAARTGASVGVAARYLARKDSSVAGLLGCGVQARATLMALVEALPSLAQVRVYDIRRESADAYVREMSSQFPALDYVICDQAAGVADDADVITTAIPILEDPEPSPLDLPMLKKGVLGVGLDYDVAWTQDAIRGCDKFLSDDIPQLMYGRSHSKHLQKIPDVIYGELGEVVAGIKPGRENNDERIFSMQMGIGIEDVVVAKSLYDAALNGSAGMRLPL